MPSRERLEILVMVGRQELVWLMLQERLVLIPGFRDRNYLWIIKARWQLCVRRRLKMGRMKKLELDK